MAGDGEYLEAKMTAYNLTKEQTDNSPCISASGDNVCKLLEKGIRVCAFNGVKLGTKLEIEGIGECVVLDRTAPQHKNRIDLAMRADQIDEAWQFGVKNIKYKIK